MKQKKSNRSVYSATLLYPIAIVIFYALGLFVCFGFSDLIPYFEGLVFSYGSGIDVLGFYTSWLYQLLPFLIIFLSGYDFLGGIYSAFASGARAILSGYLCGNCIQRGFVDKDICGVFVFSLFTLSESAILIILLSGCVEQKRFRDFYVKKTRSAPKASGANGFYVKHNLIRGGALVLCYFFRCFICFLFNFY